MKSDTLKKVFAILAIFALAALVTAAGCVTDQKTPASEPADIPRDMQYALDDLSSDLSYMEQTVIRDLAALANELTTAENISDIRRMMSTCYANHPCLTAIVFRDALHGHYISVPVVLDVNLEKYSVNITEQDFQDAGGLIVRDNVFVEYQGYQNLYYKPVYTKDGTYHGYLVFVVDAYSLIHLHKAQIDKDKLYDGYICIITDEDDKILYSSVQELTGERLTGSGLYDGLVWVPRDASGDGACTYTSDTGFYLYDMGKPTEMITAWHTMYSSHGQKYTLYLLRPVNQTEMQTENVVHSDPLQVLNDTRSAYMYAAENGKTALMEQVTSGYYETPLYVIDMDGTVIASSNPAYPDKNCLNIRSIYGTSYIESAIFTAEQGGGYIYYLTPLERTVNPRAAVYTIGVVMPVGNDYFIYSRIAGADDAVMLKPELRSDLRTLTRSMLEQAAQEGLGSVVDIVNTYRYDSPGMFVPGFDTEIQDLAVMKFDGDDIGVVTASAKYPELVGESATAKTDVYGGSATRRSLMLAKAAGGFMPLLVKNPDQEGMVDLRLTMVEPVDNEYYIYASVTVGTFADTLTPCLEKLKT